VTEIAKSVRPSKRGELEITSVIERYLESKTLSFTHLTRGAAWLDTGSPNSLNDAAAYVRIVEERTGLKIGCLEEVALSNNWISREDILANLSPNSSNSYFDYVRRL
jgi:glucose-1-phosphate thymidylyltransferase